MLNAIVGRDEELINLHAAIDRTKAGSGSTILVSGEAGIGKTALVEYVKKYASEQGFQVLAGRCLPGATSPFLPVAEALKSAGLEHLLSEEQPAKVSDLYLVHAGSGNQISGAHLSQQGIDQELFSSMLTAIQSFVKESLGKEEGGLDEFRYGKDIFAIERGKNTYIAARVEGGSLAEVRADLRKVISEFEATSDLANWDGDKSKFSDIEQKLSSLLVKHKGELDISALNSNERVLDRVAEGLKSQAKPTLLFLDDLHWADSSTLQLLHYLARNTADSSINILGTFRPKESSKLDNTIAGMSREKLYQEISLGRLSSSDVRSIVADKYNIRQPEVLEEFAKQLHARTQQGNPFYVLETLLLLEQEGIIKPGQEWWTNANLDTKSIPKTIQEIIQQRLSSLDSTTYKILKYAAVFGQEFNPKLLRKALKLESEEFGEHLENLLKTNLLVRKNSNYSFDNASVRDVVYSALTPDSKLAIHIKAAQVIESTTPSGQITDLAWHYASAAENLEEPLDAEDDFPILEKAIELNNKAGEQAKQKNAHEEASAHYEKSLKFLETLDSKLSGEQKLDKQKEKLAVLDNLQQLNHLSSNWAKSIDYSNSLINLSQALGDKEKVLDSLLARGNSEVYLARYADAIVSYETAIKLAGELKNSKKEAMAYNRLGSAFVWNGEIEKGLELSQKALQIAEGAGDNEETWSALSFIGIAHQAYETAEEHARGAEWHRRALEIANSLENIRVKARSFVGLGSALVQSNQASEGLGTLEAAVPLLKQIHDQQGLSDAYVYLGVGYASQTDYTNAKKYFDLAERLAKKIGRTYQIAVVHEEQGKMFAKQGHITGAQSEYRAAVDLYRTVQRERDAARTENLLLQLN